MQYPCSRTHPQMMANNGDTTPNLTKRRFVSRSYNNVINGHGQITNGKISREYSSNSAETRSRQINANSYFQPLMK